MKHFTSIALLACTIGAGSSIFTACNNSRPTAEADTTLPSFFEVGHRGTRGLMPENTIPAMTKGLQAGANTIEFDVHITKDSQVVVYHDASLTPSYTTMPDGSDIPEEDRPKYTLYKMDYDSIRQFIIGEKNYPAYPEQQRMRTYAPLMSEMIDSVEAYTAAHGLPPAYYLLEIKSSAKTDGEQQPAPEEYMRILMGVKELQPLGDRLLIQSFDMRPLQVLHRTHPHIRLGFLTGDKTATFEQHLEQLGFTPFFYNPQYQLVTPELIRKCHEKQIKIVPWTVQETDEMERLMAMGVDGIITDYPDRLEKARSKK